ncbi:helix-turn-helix domain-containing protein [Microvirga guangxiensis]|uniref:Transcriptional regulator, contains XRE-family HTH domain n=1 Tax=Microvirga guangxiensis TaxID=549386 RepID=A0A1G5AUA0_9HYPH|nr:cupin domain-containing protein [Microvirga guangxiensis]SCX81477.1 Transcriptional regulator, contains XRE-family HTH domain [Microvirga guangxiensis]
MSPSSDPKTSFDLEADLTDEQSQGIGQRLRKLRTERKLTIAELAAKAGVSSGIISQIEREASSPSISTLVKIRTALGVNLWQFFEDVQSPSPNSLSFVRRKDNRPRIVAGKMLLTKELLSPNSSENLRFMILTLPPGAESEEMLSGPGDKGGYVLSGRIELTVGDEVAELSDGDSFQFKSTLPHKLENRHDIEAKVIWIINIQDKHL